MLLFDPVATSRGILGLRALRLSQKFMKLYSKEAFTRDGISAVGLSFDAIYEELPIEIVNTGLLRSLIWQMEEDIAIQPSFAAFDLASNAFLEKNLSMLLDTVSDLQNEQGKVQTYQRLVARQTAQQQAVLQKRVRQNRIYVDDGKPIRPGPTIYLFINRLPPMPLAAFLTN